MSGLTSLVVMTHFGMKDEIAVLFSMDWIEEEVYLKR